MIINLVHRVNNVINSWENFHYGIEKAKDIRNNQYPSEIYESMIRTTIENISLKTKKNLWIERMTENVFINYRGTITDHFMRSFYNAKAPIRAIVTLEKVKPVLPSLKVSTDKSLSSNIIYDFISFIQFSL